MQAMQLGYLPRMALEHTSPSERGQIYIAGINWMLMVLCIALVIAFRSSSNLAEAYGVAVTTTMVVTALLMYVVMRERWHWPRYLAMPVVGFFLVIDVAFWGANLVKIPDGGWFPLVVGLIGFTLFTTWNEGRRILGERLRETTYSLREVSQRVRLEQAVHVPGTAVYMYSDPHGIPPALFHNLEHNKVIHDKVIFVSVQVLDIPYVSREERVRVEQMRDNFDRVGLLYGYMESPNVPRDLMLARRDGLSFDPKTVSYFLGRERLLASNQRGMAVWRERLFALMSRNSRERNRLLPVAAGSRGGIRYAGGVVGERLTPRRKDAKSRDEDSLIIIEVPRLSVSDRTIGALRSVVTVGALSIAHICRDAKLGGWENRRDNSPIHFLFQA